MPAELRGPVAQVAAVRARITARNLSGRTDTALADEPERPRWTLSGMAVVPPVE